MRPVVLLLLAALVLASCGGSEQDESTTPETAPADGIAALDHVLALRSDFEADKGKTRLLLLFSPT